MRLRMLGAPAMLVIALACDDAAVNLSGVPGYLISNVRVTPRVDTVFITDTIRAADRVSFSATAIGKNGGTLGSMVFAWSSSDPSIATVDSAGTVTPRRLGVVEIEASADKVGRATLVILPAIMTVSVAPAVDTIFVLPPVDAERDTLRLHATASDLNGVPLGGVAFSWSSSEPAVAVVDPTGLVSAVGLGSTTITVAGDGHQASATIHVRPFSVAGR